MGSISQESEENTLKDYASYVISGNALEGVPKNEEKSQNENFWDFRLQKATLDKEGKIRALVPQVASYLVMSNAIFSTGFSDVNKQNTLLDDMQSSMMRAAENKTKVFSSPLMVIR